MAPEAVFNVVTSTARTLWLWLRWRRPLVVTCSTTFTVPAAEFERAMGILKERRAKIGYAKLHGAEDVVKISAIGVGMRSHSGVAARAFRALAEKGVNIRAITTSEIKFSMLIDEVYTELAVRTLHTLYGLDAKG